MTNNDLFRDYRPHDDCTWTNQIVDLCNLEQGVTILIPVKTNADLFELQCRNLINFVVGKQLVAPPPCAMRHHGLLYKLLLVSFYGFK